MGHSLEQDLTAKLLTAHTQSAANDNRAEPSSGPTAPSSHCFTLLYKMRSLGSAHKDIQRDVLAVLSLALQLLSSLCSWPQLRHGWTALTQLRDRLAAAFFPVNSWKLLQSLL